MGDTKRVGSGYVIAWVLLIAALPIIYVLSFGPVSSLHYYGWLSEQTWEFIYAPILWAKDRYLWVSNILEWYMDLFLPKD